MRLMLVRIVYDLIRKPRNSLSLSLYMTIEEQGLRPLRRGGPRPRRAARLSLTSRRLGSGMKLSLALPRAPCSARCA